MLIYGCSKLNCPMCKYYDTIKRRRTADTCDLPFILYDYQRAYLEGFARDSFYKPFFDCEDPAGNPLHPSP